MRQGQQHRRGRNRNNNNNRKGQNPLTRNFESSGPDVKIRGTPAHVAEKYMSLARDALSSGDPVLAENYLQHAEHYNRIILSYREQQGQQNENQNGNGRSRHDTVASAEEADDGEEYGEEQPRVVQPGDPQPVVANGEQQRGERPERTERGEGRRRDRQPRQNASDNGREKPREGRGSSRNRDRQRFGDSDQQPDFLRRPVRRNRKDEAGEEAGSGATTEAAGEQQD